MADLFKDILEEIECCGLGDVFPLRAFIYYKYDSAGHVLGKRRILLLPPSGFQPMTFIQDRGHESFLRYMNQGDAHRFREYDWGTVWGYAGAQYRLVRLEPGSRTRALEQEAKRYGIEVDLKESETDPSETSAHWQLWLKKTK